MREEGRWGGGGWCWRRIGVREEEDSGEGGGWCGRRMGVQEEEGRGAGGGWGCGRRRAGVREEGGEYCINTDVTAEQA